MIQQLTLLELKVRNIFCSIKSKRIQWILLQGNFETQAQSLAMRQQSWLLAT